MRYIEPHAHMASRTTDDYEQLALTGCLAISDPAFWAGYDRGSAAAFAAYFEQLTAFEPKRAAPYGLRHYSWLSLNPKEAEDRDLAREVLALIPPYLQRPNVLGIGEIGLNRVTRNEYATLVDHVELAMRYDQLMLIHTPHLEDKLKGTRAILRALQQDGRVRPERVLVDHAEEHTIELILERGFWAGITLYPRTKVSPERAVDLIEMYGAERICVASACDWGPSIPTAIPHLGLEMRRRGFTEAAIEQIIFDNPAQFLGQSPNFEVPGRARSTASTV